jgi:hypothetical protein
MHDRLQLAINAIANRCDRPDQADGWYPFALVLPRPQATLIDASIALPSARRMSLWKGLHLFTARLSYSTSWFGHCYQTEDRPALFDGILRSSVEFGGVTGDAGFDNPKTAVDKVDRGRRRTVNDEFAAFTGSLAINMQFAAPAKGNEKGGTILAGAKRATGS